MPPASATPRAAPCEARSPPHVSTPPDRRRDLVEEILMRRLRTRLSGPVLIEPIVHGDDRGFFLEAYQRNVFADLGVADELVRHNHSRSRREIVRGMHFQPGMAKLIHCMRGAIIDVLVDIRRGSPTFGEWEAFELDDQRLTPPAIGW
jgi:dTDP-4-dehydrorhamnose 3,5-epimerase